MKKAISILLFTLLFNSVGLKAQSTDPEPWLLSSEYALVWTYTSLNSIDRHGCCVESSEYNACNLTIQTDERICRAGRSMGFVEIFDVNIK